jgi:type I restriction enzyme S subunit
VWNDGLHLEDVAYIPPSMNERMSGTIVQPGDVLLNITGASIGRSAVVPDNFDAANVSQHVAILRLLEPDLRNFVHLCLISPLVQRMISSAEVGISREGLSMSRLQHFVLPLPPLPEQHRIVAKVDELLAQTRALAANLRRAQAEIVIVNQAALHRLQTAGDGENLQTAWSTVSAAFDLLYDDPRPLAALRQVILQLAVSGRLTLGYAVNVMGATKAVNGWDKVRLRDVVTEIQTGPFGSMLHKADYVAGGIPVVNPANIQGATIVPIESMAVSEATVQRLQRHVLAVGDVVMARRGEMGRCARITDREAGWLCGSGSFVLKPSHLIDSEYLVRVIRSPSSRRRLSGGSVGSTMNNLNHRVLASLEVLLPPLPEQHRIVAKVDELFALCDALERKLADSAAAQRAAVKSVLAHVLQG